MVFHGEVSKRMFREIFKLRDYDLYARRIFTRDADENSNKLLAAALGKEYRKLENVSDKEAIETKVPDIFDRDGVKKLPLTTPAWEVGRKDIYRPPIGFAADPIEVSNSLGREVYYCYRGQWKNGMMCGGGEYLFGDGKTYSGGFKDNRPHGIGTAEYTEGSWYEGYWENGRYSGHGVLSCSTGSRYEGDWLNGFRHGKGRLTLPCGLEYEGISENDCLVFLGDVVINC